MKIPLHYYRKVLWPVCIPNPWSADSCITHSYSAAHLIYSVSASRSWASLICCIPEALPLGFSTPAPLVGMHKNNSDNRVVLNVCPFSGNCPQPYKSKALYCSFFCPPFHLQPTLSETTVFSSSLVNPWLKKQNFLHDWCFENQSGLCINLELLQE